MGNSSTSKQAQRVNGLNTVPFEVLEALYRYEHFVILGHQKPDADCATSQLALCLALQRLGKSVQMVSAGPFQRPEIQELAPQFDSEVNQQKISGFGRGKVLAVILDCSTLERTGFLEELQDLSILVIDHHASGEIDGDFQYCAPSSPSTSILVQNILLQLPLFLFQMGPIEYAHLVEENFHLLDQNISGILFLGFATDTGFFRFLKPDNGGDMLRLASDLVDTGINLQDIYQQMTGGRLLETRRILGLLLLRAGFLLNARLCISYSLLEDKKFWNSESNDNDSFYSLSLATQNCEAIILLDEAEKGCWNIGLRSLKQHDMGSVATKFGGGGHKNAAGCRLEVSGLKEALALILKEISDFWDLDSRELAEIREYVDG
ncbi:MAG: bifunctional oligoribonuclease/PAP phosphatase NrnA, partial [Spirochaetota bacterium]